MLNFISTGSAFNAVLGNNSAYLKSGQTLILLDCGSTIYNSLMKKGLLDQISDIFVIITHTHPDHVSSLGDLILYNQHMLSGRIQIIYKHPEIIETILTAMGVKREYYQFQKPVSGNEFVIDNQDFHLELKAYAVDHSAGILAYGYVIKNGQDSEGIYYSGDASGIPAPIMQAFSAGSIQLIYQDTASYDVADSPHLSLNKLAQLIPVEKRQRVYCMHLDEKFDVARAEKMGFKVAKSQQTAK